MIGQRKVPGTASKEGGYMRSIKVVAWLDKSRPPDWQRGWPFTREEAGKDLVISGENALEGGESRKTSGERQSFRYPGRGNEFPKRSQGKPGERKARVG